MLLRGQRLRKKLTKNEEWFKKQKVDLLKRQYLLREEQVISSLNEQQVR